MATLSKRVIKSLIVEFKAEAGYFLDFSNDQFEDFVFESTGLEIFDEKYESLGTSKAKRFKEFVRLESDPVINKLIADLRAI